MSRYRNPTHVLTTGQVARMFGAAPRTIQKLIDRGDLAGWTIPGSDHRRLSLASVIEFANARQIPLDEIAADRAAHLDADNEPKPRGLRSGHWPAVARSHLHDHPTCAACGTRKQLVVHHMRPFHVHPELELDPQNLITLCESPAHNCHLVFGHLLSWKSWNEDVIEDAGRYLAELLRRPNPHNPPPAAHAALDEAETRRAA